MSHPVNRSSKDLSTSQIHEDKPILKTAAPFVEKIAGHPLKGHGRTIRAAHGAKHPKVEKAITWNKGEVLAKPIGLWEVFPVINLMEIRSKKDVTEFTKTLSVSMTQHRGGDFVVHYDLSSLGLNRTVQVLGNAYIPVKRSEHREIHSAIMSMTPDSGIVNHQDLTFVIVNDDLYESVMHEIAVHTEKTQIEAHVEEKREERKEKLAVPHEVKMTQSSKKGKVSVFEQKWKLEFTKILNDIISKELHSKEKRAEKKEKERLKEEKCIKFAQDQFERLLKTVEKEVTQSRIEEWEESVPPFPIHSLRGSTLWRQLKSKMIEELLRH